MGKTYSSPDFKIEIQKGGDPAVDISNYVDNYGELSVEALIEDTTGFGKTFREYQASRVKAAAEITLEGFYTVGEGSAVETLNDVGATITVTNTWGESDSDSYDAIIKTFVKRPVKDQLTRWSCTIQPSGEITPGDTQGVTGTSGIMSIKTEKPAGGAK